MEKKKILIVDDEESFTRMVKFNLEKTGEYEVQVENNAFETLKTAKRFKPDLIFLDIIMPGVDGGKVAQELKDDSVFKNTPIVFLTAIVNEKEVVSKEGVIGGRVFLAKPVTLQKLITCIQENLTK